VSQAATRPMKLRSRGSVWGLRLAVVIVVVIALVGYLMSAADSRMKSALAKLDQDDPGWHLDDIEASRAVIPDEQNSARVIMKVVDLLPADWPSNEFAVAVTEQPPEKRLSPAEHGRLCNELNEVIEALAAAQQLPDLPRGRHRLVIKRPNVFTTLLLDQQKTRAVASLLDYSARRNTAEGKLSAALRDCRGIANCGRSMGDEPFLISMLIRTACVSIACNTAQVPLAQGEPPAAELEALQRLLEDEDRFSELEIGVRGERASLQEMFTAYEKGEITLKDLGDGPLPGEKFFGIFFHTAAENEHPEMLSIMTRFLEASRLPLHERPDVMDALNQEIRSMSRTHVLTRMLVPAVSSVANSSQRKHALVRTMIVCLALERYRQAKHAWPATLDALAPDYLSSVPLDPFDGKPLRYRQLPDGLVVYSVGTDRVDNEGNLADGKKMIQPGYDIGYRMWNVDKRAQKPNE